MKEDGKVEITVLKAYSFKCDVPFSGRLDKHPAEQSLPYMNGRLFLKMVQHGSNWNF